MQIKLKCNQYKTKQNFNSKLKLLLEIKTNKKGHKMFSFKKTDFTKIKKKKLKFFSFDKLS